MEMTVIKWDEIPQKDWVAALESIPIGGYLRDLPYTTSPQAPKLSIPHNSLRAPWMEFEKRRRTDGNFQDVFVWKRTQ